MKFHQFITIPACFLASIVCADTDRDVSTGALIYTQCTGCHAPDYNRTGPKQCGILGRKAGAVEGFDYTDAMKNSGIIWTRQSLDQFLRSPLNMVSGTSMGFAGITSDRERRQLISYMIQLDGDNLLCK